MRSARSKDTPRAGPPVSQVLGTPKRTSVRWPGRVFCKSKIWKGEKAAGGSHDNGGQGGAGAPKISGSWSFCKFTLAGRMAFTGPSFYNKYIVQYKNCIYLCKKIYVIMTFKTRKHPSWLRIYAIKMEPGVYVVTGGAIKLTATMAERPHTLMELNRLEIVRNYFIDNNVFDKDGLNDFLENE